MARINTGKTHRNTNHSQHEHTKIFYRPIEAAIRWSGLIRFEARILGVLDGKGIPDPDDFPQWPMLRFNLERIVDALRNGELPYGKAGITRNDPTLLDDPDLTVRHVDLKAWLARVYPDQKPAFLFDRIERQLHPVIGVDTVQVLLADREALKLRLADMEHSLKALQEQYRLLCEQVHTRSPVDRNLSPRGEATYLSIVGGLLELLLGQSPSGKPHSSFETTEAVISALLAYYPAWPGLSERTLWAKLTAARRHINTAPR